MAKELIESPAPEPEESKAPAAEKAPKELQYVGPRPAPLIANLPLDLKQPRLGTVQAKYPADQLPEKYIEFVRTTAPHTKNWWK